MKTDVTATTNDKNQPVCAVDFPRVSGTDANSAALRCYFREGGWWNMEYKVIKMTEFHVPPEFRKVMSLVSDGLSLVKAVRKVRGKRPVELLPVVRPKNDIAN